MRSPSTSSTTTAFAAHTTPCSPRPVRTGHNARIDGVLVQKMIEGGEEAIVGVQLDPVFGPVVMAGLGGIFVEVLADVSFRAAPLTLADAHDMLRELHGFPILTGLRGRAAANVDALTELLVNVSRLAADHAESILEFDLNPVKVLPDGAVVVDALLIEVAQS